MNWGSVRDDTKYNFVDNTNKRESLIYNTDNVCSTNPTKWKANRVSVQHCKSRHPKTACTCSRSYKPCYPALRHIAEICFDHCRRNCAMSANCQRTIDPPAHGIHGAHPSRYAYASAIGCCRTESKKQKCVTVSRRRATVCVRRDVRVDSSIYCQSMS